MRNICDDHDVVNPDKVRIILKERDILQCIENTLISDVEYTLKEIDTFASTVFLVFSFIMFSGSKEAVNAYCLQLTLSALISISQLFGMIKWKLSILPLLIKKLTVSLSSAST